MRKLYCITCPAGCQLTIIGTGIDMVVEGNKCDKGNDFAKHEMSNPSRTLTTTVRTKFPGIPVISVRTDGEIPRDKLMDAMKELGDVTVETELNCGDIVHENIAGTGVNVIITSAALMKLGAELENKNAELNRRGSSDDSTTAAAAFNSFTGPGIGTVVNPGVIDDLGPESADGFVGAAGEAVGVEGANDEDGSSEGKEGEGRIKMSDRPHIKRR